MPNLQALQAIPSFGSQLGQALGGGVSQGISANLQQMLGGKQQEQQESQNYSRILDEMEGILDTGGAGRQTYLTSLVPWASEAQQSTAQFNADGTALLGLAQKVALKSGIRNQKEFEAFMKRVIPNASDTKATAQGKINALRNYLGTGDFSGLQSQRTPKQSGNSVLMRDPSGQLRKVSRKDAIQAQKAGYKLEQ